MRKNDGMKLVFITAIVAFLFFGSLAIFSWIFDGHSGGYFQSPPWNDGICNICGGHYLYSQVVGDCADLDYVYICEICGQIICLENNPLTNR